MPVTTGTTEGAAAPFLASLVIEHCNVVIATGPAQIAAVMAEAHRFKGVRFAVVNGGSARNGVTVVRGPAAALRSEVASLIKSAVAASA